MAKAPRNQDDVSKLLKILYPDDMEPTANVKKQIKDLIKKEIAKGKKSGRSGMSKGGLTKKKPVKKK
jgi:hypothetical protein